MKISEIKDKDQATLSEELRALQENYLETRLRSSSDEKEGTRLKGMRRDIARYKTVISERK